MGDHVRHLVHVEAKRTIGFHGQVGAAITRHADDVDEVVLELDVADLFEVTGEQRQEELVSTGHVSLPGLARHDAPRVLLSFLHDPYVVVGELFGELVMPARAFERTAVHDVREEVHEHGGYRQFLVGQFDFNAHGSSLIYICR